MRTLIIVLSLAGLAGLTGCAGDDSATGGGTMASGTASAGTTGDSATGSTSTAQTSEGTGESTGAGATMTTTMATTMATTTTTSTTSAGTTAATTSDLHICHFGTTGGSTEPWLELAHHGIPVEDGITLDLECGLQGLFMLELVPTFGGFEPDDLDVLMDVKVDVDGFNLNPDGHFFNFEEFHFYIGCDVFDGAVGYILPVLLPDTLDDVTELHGAMGQLSVTLYPDGGGDPVTVESSFTINIEVGETWEFCGYSP